MGSTPLRKTLIFIHSVAFFCVCMFPVLGESQLKEDKLVTALEEIKFLNGPSTVYNKSRFVYLKQCGLYVEEYNVSKVR